MIALTSSKNGISIGVEESGNAINSEAIALFPVVVVVLRGQGSPVNHLVVLHKEVVPRVYYDPPAEDETYEPNHTINRPTDL